MVNNNTGLPNSGDLNDSLPSTTNEVVLVNPDEDSSEDETAYSGYEPLPVSDYVDDQQSDELIEMDEDTTTNEVAARVVDADEEIAVEVWSSSAPKEVDIEMDSKKVDEVKLLMKNVLLPESSIPEWAANVSEDEWKVQLANRLKHIQK